MNDRLSPNSLILAGKVTRDKVAFIRGLVLVLDGTLRNVFGLYNIGTLQKYWHSQDENVTPINFKKLADISLFIRSFSQK